MADGRLIFPVKFDLKGAVDDAIKDGDKALTMIEKFMRGRAIRPKFEFDTKEYTGLEKGMDSTLEHIQRRMAKLQDYWNRQIANNLKFDENGKLSESVLNLVHSITMLADGTQKINYEHLSPKQIYKEFVELTAAVRTQGVTLREYARDQQKVLENREKLTAKYTALKNPDMNSLTEVKASLKYYEQLAGSAKQFSAGWEVCIQKVKELKARSQELSDIYKTMTRQNVFNMPEGNLNEVRDKLKALKIQMEQATPKSDAWNEYSNQLSRLREVEKGMAADQKQAIKTEAELRAEKAKAANEELANQRRLKAERAKNVSDVERERAARQQSIAQKRQELAVLNGEERSLDQVNAKLAIRKRLLESSRQGTSFYDNNFKEVLRLEDKQRDMTSRLPEAQRKEQEALNKALIEEAARRAEIYNKKRRQEAEDLAAQQRKAAEEARIKQESVAKEQQANEARKRILNEQRLSYDTLTQKIQMLEAARNRTDIGAARWQRLTGEINKARESLKVITDEMDKAARRAERLARLREILAMSARSMEGLNARIQEANTALQKLDYGTAAFDRLARKIALLSEEYQKAQRYAQDFQNKAFQGIDPAILQASVDKLRRYREELAVTDGKIHEITQLRIQTGNSTMDSTRMNQLLDQRIAKQKEISEIIKTAEQQQAEREKEINRIIESRKAKQKAHSDAVRNTVQQRKQERAMLMASERTVENITKKLQHWQTKLNSTDMRSGQFQQIAKEVERLTRKLDEAKRKIAELTGQSTSGASTQARNARRVSEEYTRQLGYIDRLIRRMAVYGSVGMIGNFLTKIREVTAQFELQRVSLGAILQDQNKANQLFSEIKSFALKSPVSILDLTKYTKQLAAYKIGYDELFETTKKLTDVSVGLGVSMDRVVLAYGQVRATGHLRASEIRQFTEMGVPIVEELAAKLSKLNGETVTAAQVMDMVSKRAISFQMVKEVFDDMTSAGGIFYNMQEKQGNTLYGLWAKLGDAASVMYSEIGNVGAVNAAMKEMISGITTLMKNWRLVGGEIMVLAAGFGAYKLMQNLTTASTVAASKATRDHARAYHQLRIATVNSSKAQQIAAVYSMRAASADLAAANATNAWTAAKLKLTAAAHRLRGALAGNWMTVAITAVAALVVAFVDAYRKAHELENKLNDIQAETVNLQNQSVGRFEQLANAAVKSANGSKEQRDALAELNRAYKDILPQASLKLENLRKMTDGYAELTRQIREYIAELQRQKAMNAISEKYGADINSASKAAIDDMNGVAGMDRTVAANIVGVFQRKIQEGVAKGLDYGWNDFTGHFDEKQLTDVLKKSAKEYGVTLSDEQAEILLSVQDGLDKNPLERITKAIKEQNVEVEEQQNILKGNTGEYGKTLEKIEQIKEATKNIKLQGADGKPLDENSFLAQQMTANFTMKQVADAIKNDPTLPNALRGKIEECMHIVESVNPKDLGNITTVNFDAILEVLDGKYPEFQRNIELFQKEWGNVAPTNQTALQIRNKLFTLADAFKAPMERMARYLWDGSGSVDDYLKRLKEQQEELKARIKVKQTTLEHSAKLSLWFKKWVMGKDVEAELKELKAEAAALDKLIPYVTEYTVPEKDKNKGGRQSDTRLQTLQEISQTLEKINKEYDDLSKKEGKTKALEDIKNQFKDTLDYTNKLGRKFGLHFDYPTEFRSLQQYREEILKVMKSLKNLKGGEKAILEFQTMIGKSESDELQRQIEEQLKDIAEKISRAKVADEFYRKILSATGDYSLAGQMAESIFGQDGRKLRSVLAEQVRGLTNGLTLPDGIISPDNIINYKALRDWAEANKDKLGKMYDELIKISENGQKGLAKSYEGYLKDLEKAKTYADKRVELARTTAAKIREIERNPQYTKEQKEELKRGYQEREDREAAKLEYEAFKDTPLYVQMFEDLERASTSTLEMMKSRLEALSGVWGTALDPTQLKEIQSRMNEIDTQLRERNPFKTLKESYQQYRDAVKSVSLQGAVENAEAAAKEHHDMAVDYGADSAQARAAEKELKVREQIVEIARKVTAENEKGAKALDEAARIANDNLKIARGHLELAKAEEEAAVDKATKEGKDPAKDPGVIAAHEKVEAAKEEVNLAERVAEITTNNAKTAKTLKENFVSAANQVTQYMGMAGDLAHAVADTMEALGGDEDDVQFWNDIGDAIGDLTAGFQGIIDSILSLNVAGIISNAIGVIPNMVKGFVGLFSAGKVRRANKEIKRQQKLLEQLEYSYSRLEKAADRLFGADWLANQNRQLQLLEAEAKAKQKQAEAERSKGKKEDKEKTKQYLEEARDIRDQIADMQGSVSEKMFGTDLASAARDFAKAWLDAYKEFENTADAMSEKFHEMIQNMIAESLLAKVMERALKPAFDMIDGMSTSDFYSEGFWKRLMTTAEDGAQNADRGAQVVMDWVEKMGINMRDTGAEFSGIAKDIAGATSEEINSAAAIGNTLMYYVSPIPRIDENVARIAAIMQGGSVPAINPDSSYAFADYTPLLTAANEHLSSLPRMEQHLAEIHTMLGRVITSSGGRFVVNTLIRQ